LSWSHTVGSGSDRILVVGVARLRGATAAVTFGGEGLVRQIVTGTPLGSATSELWTLLDPSPGTAIIVVTTKETNQSETMLTYAGSVSFTGVDQKTPVRATSGAGESPLGAGNRREVLLEVGSDSGDVVVDCASCQRGWITEFAPLSGAQTVLWSIRTGFSGGGSQQSANAETTTMSWGCGGPSNSLMTALAVSALSLVPATFVDLFVVNSGEATISAGGKVTYEISVANAGPDYARNVTMSDVLPADVEFVSAIQNSGPPFSCSYPSIGSAGVLTCTLDKLPPGESARFTLVAQVPVSVLAGTTLTNVASIASASTELDAVNNLSAASTIVTGAVAVPAVSPGALVVLALVLFAFVWVRLS
jgi:uncharacterized repeat protein (TIGR01451 family)